MAELTGRPAEVVVHEVPGTQRGLVADVSRRRAITGPCRVGWRQGLRRTCQVRYGSGPMGECAIPVS